MMKEGKKMNARNIGIKKLRIIKTGIELLNMADHYVKFYQQLKHSQYAICGIKHWWWINLWTSWIYRASSKLLTLSCLALGGNSSIRGFMEIHPYWDKDWKFIHLVRNLTGWLPYRTVFDRCQGSVNFPSGDSGCEWLRATCDLFTFPDNI